MRWHSLIAVALLSACTVGVSIGTVAAPASDGPAAAGIPSGWHAVTNRATVSVADVSKAVPTGFRIALPDDWSERQFSRETVAAVFRAWAAQHPSDAAKTTEQAYVDGYEKAARLLASPDDVSPDHPVELHVLARTIDAVVTLDRLIADQTRLYRVSNDATMRQGSRLKIGDQDAYALRMQWSPAAPARVMAITSFLLVREREIWVLEFLGPLDEMDRLDPLFDQIAATFLLL